MRKQEKGEKEKVGVSATTTTPATTPRATKTASTTTASSAASATPTRSAASSTPTMGMKHSKSDHSGLAGRGGKTAATANKKYMSKSQENLSTGTGKKKLTTVKEVDPSAASCKTVSTLKTSSGSGAKLAQASAMKSASTSAAERNKENQVGHYFFIIFPCRAKRCLNHFNTVRNVFSTGNMVW